MSSSSDFLNIVGIASEESVVLPKFETIYLVSKCLEQINEDRLASINCPFNCNNNFSQEGIFNIGKLKIVKEKL